MAAAEKPAKDRTSEREAKLAQALRANLRRRKAGESAAGKARVDAKSGDEG